MQTETATLLSYLPDKSRDVTIKFANKMMESFTDNLVSVILYGSAAGRQDAASEGNFIEGKSDINILIILQSVRAVDLNIVLDNGKVIEEGLHDELISKSGGIYKKLWELQTDHEIE